MVKVTSSLVRDLRELTGVSILNCKNALIEANGNIELAIENMRKSGAIKAAKKANSMTNEGLIITKIKSNYGIILEINCQTDFVAKSADFQSFANKVSDTAIIDNINNIEELRMLFEKNRIELVAKIGENVNIRRIASLKGEEILGSYQHGMRIGVLVSVKGTDDQRLIKQLAMHIAACNPKFINSKDIPTKIIEKEHQIQLNIAMQSGKPKEIIEKIAEGRLEKFKNEISLNSQLFVINPDKTISQVLEENHANIIEFIRFELGESIETDKEQAKINAATKVACTIYK